MFNMSTRQEQFSSEIDVTGAHAGDSATILGKLTVSELEVTGVSNLKGDANVDGSATFNGGTNLSLSSDSDSDSQSSGGSGTFTNLTVDNLTVTNGSNFKGGANVEGKLRLRHAGANGSDDTDPYFFEKMKTSNDQNHLRLTLNDKNNESFQIWGDSCGVNTGPKADRGCGGPGKKLFSFKGDGKMSATAGATFGNTYVGPSAHTEWAGVSHKDNVTTGGYALIQSADGQTLLNSAANQHVKIRQNNADKMRMETNGHFTTMGNSTVNGSTTGKGGINVEGKLIFRHAGANGNDNTDVYHMEKLNTAGVAGGSNKLRMTLNDDPNEEFEIWGGGGQGTKKFGFKADGTVHGISSGGASSGGDQTFGKITASELEVTGPSHLIGNTTTEGLSTFNGNMSVSGNSTVNGQLNVKNGSRFEGGRHYFKDSENAGNLRVGAAWGIPGIYAENGNKVVVGSANEVDLRSTHASNGTKLIGANNHLTVEGNSTVGGNSTVSGNSIVSGNSDVGANLRVTGTVNTNKVLWNGSPWSMAQEGADYMVLRSSSNPDKRHAFKKTASKTWK